jgi:hypothetical protein
MKVTNNTKMSQYPDRTVSSQVQMSRRKAIDSHKNKIPKAVQQKKGYKSLKDMGIPQMPNAQDRKV